MANILDPTTGTAAKVDAGFATARVHAFPNGNAYFVNGTTGTIAAATNGEIFAMRLDPSSAVLAYITFIKVDFRCIVAFTTPATPRFLRLRRFTGTAASGGTAITTVMQADPNSAASEFTAAGGGDIRVGATTNIAAPGTPDTFNAERVNLTNFGAANTNLSTIWTFKHDSNGRPPIILRPGNSIAIGTTAAFDAAGTWEADILVGWSEGVAP